MTPTAPRVALPILLLLAAGCGFEASDTRMQARAEAGLEQHAVVRNDGEFSCPNLVTITNQPFNPSSIAAGEVEDAFGPFAPCANVVPAGEGKCTNCNQEYRTSGESGPPLALPVWRCPHCEAHVDPVTVFLRDVKEPMRGPSSCPKCKGYFTVSELDLLKVVDFPHEMFCPGCRKPVDPTMNACATNACKLNGVVRNTAGGEGPCWRCSGMARCPECYGAGQGTRGAHGSTPADCWVCRTTGHCPECEGKGSIKYEGSLPAGYTAWTAPTRDKAAQPLPQDRRNWKHQRDNADD